MHSVAQVRPSPAQGKRSGCGYLSVACTKDWNSALLMSGRSMSAQVRQGMLRRIGLIKPTVWLEMPMEGWNPSECPVSGTLKALAGIEGGNPIVLPT